MKKRFICYSRLKVFGLFGKIEPQNQFSVFFFWNESQIGHKGLYEIISTTCPFSRSLVGTSFIIYLPKLPAVLKFFGFFFVPKGADPLTGKHCLCHSTNVPPAGWPTEQGVARGCSPQPLPPLTFCVLAPAVGHQRQDCHSG